MKREIIKFLLESLVIFLATKIITKGYLDKYINPSSNIPSNQTNITSNYTYNYTFNSQNVNCSSLGKHTWAVLHSIAASYANFPNETEKHNFQMFFDGLINSYPSNNSLIKEIIKEKPLEHNSREELVYYICEIHNIMNKKLNKTKFNCRNAFDIWGGDCGCNS